MQRQYQAGLFFQQQLFLGDSNLNRIRFGSSKYVYELFYMTEVKGFIDFSLQWAQFFLDKPK